MFTKFVYRSRGNTLAEFAPVLFVLFVLIIVPLLDLLAYATGVSTVSLLTRQCATTASQCMSYRDALQSIEEESTKMCASGFGRFAKLRPVGGYNGSGTDLFIIVTDVERQIPYYFGPNNGFPNPLSKNAEAISIFEYEVRSRFEVGPLLPINFPGLNTVPIVGRPAPVQYFVSRVIENPQSIAARGAQPSFNTDDKIDPPANPPPWLGGRKGSRGTN